MRGTELIVALAAGGLLGSCGDAGLAAKDSSGGGAAADAGANGPSGEDGYGGAGGSPLPPEDETEVVAFSPPAVGKDHVWVASRDNDLLLRIDARTRAVEAVPVGDAPSVVVTVPDEERGVVLNRGSDELALVEAQGDAAGSTDVEFFRLARHFNALTLDPTARYAVAWYDLSRAEPGEDSTALQDAVVLDLTTRELHPLSTGFRPRAPFFADDGETCFLVTEDGVSVIDLAHPDAHPRVLPTAVDPFHQDGREVAISPDGGFVVSRAREGSGETSITVLTPADGALREIPVGGEPTDLDLFADGTRALVMLRGVREAVVVSLATGEVAVRLALPAPLGSAAVSPQGDKALLYTTLPTDSLAPRIGVLDLTAEPPTLLERPVRKEIAGAVIDPGGRAAFLLHRKADGEADPTLPEEEFLARSHGYSLIDLDTLFVRLVTTPAEPVGVLFSADLPRAWVPLSRADTGVHELQILDLQGLSVRNVALPSAPETVGEVPAADRLFVTQAHPEGRISFLDRDSEGPDTDALQTLSGYLLNGRIE